MPGWLRVRELTKRFTLVLFLILAAVAWHAEVQAAQLQLTWNDNSDNEAGFKIERKVGTTGSYAQVAVVGPNLVSYVDLGRTLGVTYCYRARAYNAVGESAYSNEACRAATITSSAEPKIVTAPGAGGGPHVRGFGATGDPTATSFMAYNAAFTGGVFVALGKLNGAQTIITGAGAGGGPHVQSFGLDGSASGVSFMAYDVGFTGGVRTASCDVDGDGQAEIITAPAPGGGPHVRVWKVTGTGASLFTEFFAYAPEFTGGVFVACGDVDGSGSAAIITGAGPGGGPHVGVWKVAYDGLVTPITSFFAYNPAFRGGVFVAAGDVDNDGRAEIITGAGPGGGPHVAVWKLGSNGSITALVSFFAYDLHFTGGVRVAAGDLNGDGRAEVITGAGPGGGPHVRSFAVVGSTVVPNLSFFAYDPAFTGGVFVAGQ